MPPRALTSFNPPSSSSICSLCSLASSASLALLSPRLRLGLIRPAPRRASSSASSSSSSSPPRTINDLPLSRLNPAPDDYAAPNFADRADLTLYAGRGGNGCVSFQREAFLPDGPPNGGDGGHGGNVYIQAVPGETSLHKLARRRFVRAGRGAHGQGSARSGTRGDDVVISVPVGTIVRELERRDPAADEALAMSAWHALQKQRRREETTKQPKVEEEEEDDDDDYSPEIKRGRRREQRRTTAGPEDDDAADADADDPQRRKWLLYPGMTKSEARSAALPRLPRRTQLFRQPDAPIYLDLTRPSPTPILLAAGGVGGLGNPHFTSRDHPRPVFATRGDDAVTLKISLELKLLADVGLVGLPNAGKSTLLRALTNSRARVGSWAFTTLQPNIGTVVLDRHSGRPALRARRPRQPEPEPEPKPLFPGQQLESPVDHNVDNDDRRARFTVADIPGLIEGAHLDRGLGIAFLRHVERAAVLAFVVDLSAGDDAAAALRALWREVGLYARMREDEERARDVAARVDWDPDPDPDPDSAGSGVYRPAAAAVDVPPRTAHVIAGKPWFVVATKADRPGTQANFGRLKAYVERVGAGEEPHPSGVEGWTARCAAIPVSAINGQGVDRIVHWTVGLLEE